MVIGVVKEIYEGETRVAIHPSSIAGLKKKKHEVIVETGAGLGSFITDAHYEKDGATIMNTAEEVYGKADIVIKVQPPMPHPSGKHEAEMLVEGKALISYLAPFSNQDVVKTLAKRNITAFAMEFIPRITRAQSMDSLSSMATLAGYKAVIIAADNSSRMFPMLMTAAGTVPPATVLVLGAGVAGLQAIATAKRLGAKIEAFDPRPVVKEQIESLGATFIAMEITEDVSTAGGYAKEASDDFLRKEQETIAARLPRVDVVICTAQIFGKKAPILITEEMMKLMPKGAVIVDLAAEQGGNCEATRLNERVEEHGVLVFGPKNIPNTLPLNASMMYSKNVVTLLGALYSDSTAPNFEDEVTVGACITHGGEVKNEMVKKAIGG
jgi:H+-translocating NAD(P) transhydrogenase subunit alpha